jgi:hypothetical protein
MLTRLVPKYVVTSLVSWAVWAHSKSTEAILYQQDCACNHLDPSIILVALGMHRYENHTRQMYSMCRRIESDYHCYQQLRTKNGTSAY